MDPASRRIAVRVLEARAYQAAGTFGLGEEVPSRPLPGIVIPVDAVLQKGGGTPT